MPASCLLFSSGRCSCAHGAKEVQFLSCAHEQTALGTRALLTNNIQSAPRCKSDQSGAAQNSLMYGKGQRFVREAQQSPLSN